MKYSELTEEQKQRKRAAVRRFYWKHRDEESIRIRETGVKLKAEVLTYYGNGKAACVKCGFSDIRALCLDHINGGGTKESRKGGTRELYRRLRREGYPNGY